MLFDQKKGTDYEQKGCPTAINSIKQVDVESRIVSGYYASFDTVDSDGDRFAQGAFAESIEAWGPGAENPRIKHLNQHSVFQPIGRPFTLEEDDTGLYFETEIREGQLGDEVLAGYALNLFEHSVGFNRLEEDPSDDGTTIIRAWLWEGSNVTWGANQNTPFLGFKSIAEAQDFLAQKVGTLIDFINGRPAFSQEWELHLALEQIKAEISRLDRYDLSNRKQTDTTDGEDPPMQDAHPEEAGHKADPEQVASQSDDVEPGTDEEKGSEPDKAPVQIKMPTFFDLGSDEQGEPEEKDRDGTLTFFTTTN